MYSHSGTHTSRKSIRGPATTGRRAVLTAHSIHLSVLAKLYLPSVGSMSTQRIGIETKSHVAPTARVRASEKFVGSTAHPTSGGLGSTTPTVSGALTAPSGITRSAEIESARVCAS